MIEIFQYCPRKRDLDSFYKRLAGVKRLFEDSPITSRIRLRVLPCSVILYQMCVYQMCRCMSASSCAITRRTFCHVSVFFSSSDAVYCLALLDRAPFCVPGLCVGVFNGAHV